MPLVLADRVRETTTTTGTGTISLAGPVSGFQGFNTAIGNANTTYYTIVDAATGAWEVGLGTYTSSGSTLARTTVLSSSNSDALVPFGAGTKDVFVTQPAERAVYILGAGTGLAAGAAAFTANGVPYASATNTLTTGSALTFDGSQLGINKASGSLLATIHAFAAGGSSLRLDRTGAGTSTIISVESGVAYRDLTIDAANSIFSIAGSEGMRLTSTGLGIGTSSPGAKLDVAALASSVGLKVRGGGNTGINILDIADAGGSGPLVLNASGNLGIGTSSPAYKLHVSNYMGLGTQASSGAGAGINMIPSSTLTNWFVGANYVNPGAFEIIPSTAGGGSTFSTPAFMLSSSGNLGLGVTPSAWSSSYKAFDINSSSSVAAYSSGMSLFQNCYWNGTNFIYKTSATATAMSTDNGTFYWRTAASGNAGNAITFTQAMTLDASGNLGVGATSPVYQTQIYGAGQTTAALTDAGNKGGSLLLNTPTVSAGDGGALLLGAGGSGAKPFAAIKGLLADGGGNTTGSIAFSTRNATGDTALTERARIDSSGNLLVGTTSASTGNVNGSIFFGGTDAGIIYLQRQTGTDQLRFYTGGNRLGYVNTASSILTLGTANFPLVFATNDAERARITSGGDLLLGTTTQKVTVVTGGATGMTIGGASAPTIALHDTTDTSYVAYLSQVNDITYFGNNANGPISIGTGGTERARITSGGDLLVGTTSNTSVSGVSSNNAFVASTNNRWITNFRHTTATTPWGVAIDYTGVVPNNTTSEFLWCTDGTMRASIRSNGGLANYQANDVNLSDRREKTNFAPAKSYLDTICAIPVQTFEYIDQSPDDPGLTLGVVAQDVQAVAPELVMESNWGTEDNPKMRLSIYQADLQYALMKCIQELKAEVDSLKAQLKGA